MKYENNKKMDKIKIQVQTTWGFAWNNYIQLYC